MKLLTLFIKYRLWLGFISLAGAIVVNYISGFWPSFILYLIALICIVGHLIFGPLRLIQEHLEAGDLEKAEKIIKSIKFPGLLIKPVRSVYYTLRGNLAMMNKDLDGAEKLMKKSIDLGMPMKEAEGANKLQLGMISMQKGDMKQGEAYIRQAIRAGLPDKESAAMAYFQMCQIYINKREFRAAKDFFRKAKAQKPTTQQVVDQIKQMEKYINRIPG